MSKNYTKSGKVGQFVSSTLYRVSPPPSLDLWVLSQNVGAQVWISENENRNSNQSKARGKKQTQRRRFWLAKKTKSKIKLDRETEAVKITIRGAARWLLTTIMHLFVPTFFFFSLIISPPCEKGRSRTATTFSYFALCISQAG